MLSPMVRQQFDAMPRRLTAVQLRDPSNSRGCFDKHTCGRAVTPVFSHFDENIFLHDLSSVVSDRLVRVGEGSRVIKGIRQMVRFKSTASSQRNVLCQVFVVVFSLAGSRSLSCRPVYNAAFKSSR